VIIGPCSNMAEHPQLAEATGLVPTRSLSRGRQKPKVGLGKLRAESDGRLLGALNSIVTKEATT